MPFLGDIVEIKITKIGGCNSNPGKVKKTIFKVSRNPYQFNQLKMDDIYCNIVQPKHRISHNTLNRFPLVSFGFLWCSLTFFGILGLGGFYSFPLVSFDFLWFGAGWILWFSFNFLWFPSVSFGFIWCPLISVGFLWFPLVSFDFLWFSLVWGWVDSMVFLWFPLFSFGFVWFPREKQRERKSKKKTKQPRKV